MLLSLTEHAKDRHFMHPGSLIPNYLIVEASMRGGFRAELGTTYYDVLIATKYIRNTT
jgi:hypothetical protein